MANQEKTFGHNVAGENPLTKNQKGRTRSWIVTENTVNKPNCLICGGANVVSLIALAICFVHLVLLNHLSVPRLIGFVIGANLLIGPVAEFVNVALCRVIAILCRQPSVATVMNQLVGVNVDWELMSMVNSDVLTANCIRLSVDVRTEFVLHVYQTLVCVRMSVMVVKIILICVVAAVSKLYMIDM